MHLLATEFDCPEVAQCGQQEAKIQLLTNKDFTVKCGQLIEEMGIIETLGERNTKFYYLILRMCLRGLGGGRFVVYMRLFHSYIYMKASVLGYIITGEW